MFAICHKRSVIYVTREGGMTKKRNGDKERQMIDYEQRDKYLFCSTFALHFEY